MTRATRRAVLAGLAAAWVPAAFGAGPSERQLQLTARWHAARRRGAPLLVLVNPADDRAWHRGRVLGGVLGEADDALLAALAAFEPACATVDDLHLLGAVAPRAAWFVRVQTDRVPAETTSRSVRETGDDADIDRATAALRAFLPAAAPTPEAVAAGRLAWVTSRLPGSRWAHEGGCGGWVEAEDGSEEESSGFACGMGSVPERAARFLSFAEREW